MKKLLAILLMLTFLVSAVPVFAVVEDEVNTLDTKVVLYDESGFQETTKKCGIALDRHYSFVVIRATIPGGFAANQVIDSYTLELTATTLSGGYDPLHKNYPAFICKVDAAEVATWKTKDDGLYIFEDESYYVSTDDVVVSSYNAETEPNAKTMTVDLTDYANELIKSDKYDAEKGIDVCVAYACKGYTASLRVGNSSSGYSRPATTMVVRTLKGVDTEPLKVAEKQEPSVSAIDSNIKIYHMSNDENSGRRDRTDRIGTTTTNLLTRYSSSNCVLFDVNLPKNLESNQTIEKCVLNFTVSKLSSKDPQHKDWPLYICKVDSAVADAWSCFNDVKPFIDNNSDYLVDYAYLSDSAYDEGGAFRNISLDLTDYANEYIKSETYIGNDSPKLCIVYCHNGYTSNLKLGPDFVTESEVSVKTTPVIEYDNLESLDSIETGNAYVAVTKSTNIFDIDDSVLIMIAQYKLDGGVKELISITGRNAIGVPAKINDYQLISDPFTVDEEADIVKVFVVSDEAEVKPLSSDLEIATSCAQ
ncbi:MAG: hypothetical protein IJB70_07810 [Clostridia bacterium]|nr:hypothetical protein [Clostridia bacterium]